MDAVSVDVVDVDVMVWIRWMQVKLNVVGVDVVDVNVVYNCGRWAKGCYCSRHECRGCG